AGPGRASGWGGGAGPSWGPGAGPRPGPTPRSVRRASGVSLAQAEQKEGGGNEEGGRAGQSRRRTLRALSRRNLGHTSSRNGTFGSSEKIRSRVSPIGK